MNTRDNTQASPAAQAPVSMLRWLAGLVMLAAMAIYSPAQAVTTGGVSDQPVVHHLLDSMARSDYPGFISQSTPEFASVGEAQFLQVATAIAPRLQQGYSVQYLGNLRQQGLDISVWKVSFRDQGDDLLATLNVRNGLVGGFFLR